MLAVQVGDGAWPRGAGPDFPDAAQWQQLTVAGGWDSYAACYIAPRPALVRLLVAVVRSALTQQKHKAPVRFWGGEIDASFVIMKTISLTSLT